MQNEVRFNSLNRRGRPGASCTAATRPANPDMLSEKGVLNGTRSSISGNRVLRL